MELYLSYRFNGRNASFECDLSIDLEGKKNLNDIYLRSARVLQNLELMLLFLLRMEKLRLWVRMVNS